MTPRRIPTPLLFIPVFFAAITVTIVVVLVVTRSTARARIKIGILTWVTSEDFDKNIAAFKLALSELEYEEGVRVDYVVRSADADPERQRGFIREFRADTVDLIYSLTTPGTLIVKEESPDIPVVFSIVTYPVEAGFAESTDRPGGNLTGSRNWIKASEQLSAFREIMPTLRVLGFVHNEKELNSSIQLEEFTRAGEGLGIHIVDVAAESQEALQKLLENPVEGTDALYGACDTMIQAGGGKLINAYASRTVQPSFSCVPQDISGGGLLGVTYDAGELGRASGQKAVRILEGASPSDIPISGSMPRLLLNAARAKALGLTVPESLLIKASH